MSRPTLLILAAGMGSRYGGLKQLDAMGPMGETMLDYAVQDAINAGFDKVVFVIRRDFEKAFREHISSQYDQQIHLQLAFQEQDDLPPGFISPSERTKPWGTAHAIYAARTVIDEPFAVINADDFYGPEAYEILAKNLSEQDPAKLAISMVGYQLTKTLSPHGSVNRGACRIKNGLLQSVEEFINIRTDEKGVIYGDDLQGVRRPLSADTMVSMNCWGFTPVIFNVIEKCLAEFLQAHGQEMKSECYIPTVIDELIQSNRCECEVMPTTSPWFGVTYPEDKQRVVSSLKKLFEAGQYA